MATDGFLRQRTLQEDSPDFMTAEEDHEDNHCHDDQDSLLLNGIHGDLAEPPTNDNDDGEMLDLNEFHYSEGQLHERRPLIADEDDQTVFDRQEEFFTVEDAVEHMGFGRFQIKIWFICGLFSATDALEMLLLSVLSPVLRCEWLLSQTEVALITTVVFLGMWIGSYFWGMASDKYGRFTVMMIACVWILYFGLLTSFSPNYGWILLLRSTVGFGFGGALQSFTLQSEFLPSKYRAKVLILNNIMWAVGSCFEVLMAYLIIPTWGWRWLVGVSALPMIITIFFVWTLPESARYLVAAGRKQDATAVLIKASKMNGTTIPNGRLIQSEENRRGSFRDLVNVEYLRTTLSIWLLWFGTAFSYYGMVLAQSEILEFHKTCGSAPGAEDAPMTEQCHCNLLSRDDYKQMIIATFGEFVVIPLNFFTIDLIGRKWTLVMNYIGAGLFFLLIQLCVSRTVETMFIFGVRAFTAGIFNTVYIYTSEVYPTTVRSLGLGSGSAMARVGAMITPFVAQVILQWSLRVSLWMYGGLCLICAVTALSLPIETKGREMKQGQQGRNLIR